MMKLLCFSNFSCAESIPVVSNSQEKSWCCDVKKYLEAVEMVARY